MARFKNHVVNVGLDGVPYRVGTYGHKGRLWAVPFQLPVRGYKLWVTTDGNHPVFMPMRRWLKDPLRPGEYCWKRVGCVRLNPAVYEITFLFTNDLTAFEFKMAWS